MFESVYTRKWSTSMVLEFKKNAAENYIAVGKATEVSIKKQYNDVLGG
jgi:hypothetical protein